MELSPKFLLPILTKRPDTMTYQEYKDYQKIYKKQMKTYKKGELIHASLVDVIKHRSDGQMIQKQEGRTYESRTGESSDNSGEESTS